MSPPSRTEFLQSRFYCCALAFNKRNEERLKNIRDLLEKVDQQAHRQRPANKKRNTPTWKIPDCDDRATKRGNNKEDQAILSANKDDSNWVYDESKGDYALSFGGITVMRIPTDMYERLKPFQRDAVKWCAGVTSTGGILADDMGMGKTFMSIAALGARMRVKRVRMVLIVAPVSVLGGWADEGRMFLSKFCKTVRIVKVHRDNPKDRQKIVRNAWKDSSPDRPHVIITSWGLAAAVGTVKTFLPPSGHAWDYVILDEAHEAKNHNSNRYKCCRRICHRRGTNRLLLTGTPFQNDATELWSIVNLATAGKVVGKLKDFNKEYGKPIRDARCKNASSYATKQGEKANEQLQSVLKPYLLRRRKMDFLMHELPQKLDICVWVKPSSQQQRMYREIVQANGYLAQDILSSDTAFNKAFQVLDEFRKVCGHPSRLQKGGAGGSIRSKLEQTDLSTILNGSKKLELVVHMLKGFKSEDCKTLLFSQSTQNLDVIQYVLTKQNQISFCRFDGSVSENRRRDTVECFQNGMFDVMLISTGAGGVGLNLTKASRVIVYDPSWNPSQDAQAVDRAYRIGQDKEVRVYRLFLAGSVEEKMYEKQVHKSGLEATILMEAEGSNPAKRYFDKHELCKVFAQIPDGNCKLLKRFEEEGVAQVPDAHRHALVKEHSSVVGISNHSNIYNQKRKNAFAEAPSIDAKRLKATTTETTSATEVSPVVVSKGDASTTAKATGETDASLPRDPSESERSSMEGTCISSTEHLASECIVAC